MAYDLACRLSESGAGSYRVRITAPDGVTREHSFAAVDLPQQISAALSSQPLEALSIGTKLFDLLFAGAEPLLDIAAQLAPLGADQLARVMLVIASESLDAFPWELALVGRSGPPFEIVRSVSVQPQLIGQPPALPFRVLLANMGSPHEDTRTFPLRTVLLNIFGDAERLTKVFHPSTLAGANRDELSGVLARSRYEIVHLQVLTQWSSFAGQSAAIDSPGYGAPLTSATLLLLLQSAQTRLLILHLRAEREALQQGAQLANLARGIVAGGGPAVLIMPFDPPDPRGGTVMLSRFYDHIVHDQPLDAALHRARMDLIESNPTPAARAIAARPVLMLGSGAENLLRVSALATDFTRRASVVRHRVGRVTRKMDWLDAHIGIDFSSTRNALAGASERFDQAERIVRGITSWEHEGGGLMPMHEATEAVEESENDLSVLETQLDSTEEVSGRVVNLLFRSETGDVTGLETLAVGKPYWLRMQICRPWRERNIVRNTTPVPEGFIAAHSDEQGIDLDVCLYHMDDGFALEEEAFVLHLPRAPAASNHLDMPLTPKKSGTARLRVAIYYQRNLIQSLMVVAEVASTQTLSGDNANYAEVEFSMADTMLGAEDLRPRTLNLLTNDGGDGTYRIAIRGTDIKLQYTLTGSTAITDVRKALLNICAVLDEKGNPKEDGYRYSDSDNSGDEAKLIADLKVLAPLGFKLYSDLIMVPANWEEQDPLEERLKQPGEIQVSITSSARNVYPWALLYDRKLEIGTDNAVCPVMLKKLTGAAQAGTLQAESCIDGDCRHAADTKMICPLGFWGFRHAVEQLPPNQGKIVDTITAPHNPSFIMAVHQKLAAKEHRAEVERAAGITAQYCDLKSAIGAALKSAKPHFIYFYCHSGRSDHSPWLGVGSSERIVPSDFLAWDTRWKDTTPIVVVNGCHTVDLNPDDLLDFVKTFAWCRAAGVIGTEIAIPESLAREFGTFFVGRFLKGDNKEGDNKVATILRDFRLTLLAKRNVLGLAYSPYCLGDLRLVFS